MTGSEVQWHIVSASDQEAGDWNLWDSVSKEPIPCCFTKANIPVMTISSCNKKDSKIKGKIFKVQWKELASEKMTRWLEES